MNWRKSTRSNEAACIEVAAESAPAHWRKSGFSQGASNCVEAGDGAGAVFIRDTTDNGHGLVLTVTPQAWRAFLSRLP